MPEFKQLKNECRQTCAIIYSMNATGSNYACNSNGKTINRGWFVSDINEAREQVGRFADFSPTHYYDSTRDEIIKL